MDNVITELYAQLFIIAVIYIAIVLFVGADLVSGIRKAKKRGEFRSSFGLRKTIQKIGQYFNVMVVLTIMDCLIMLLQIKGDLEIPIFPYLTFVGSLLVGIIEVGSIYEKAEDKEKVRANEAINLLSTIVKNREDIDAMLELIKKQKEKREIKDN